MDITVKDLLDAGVHFGHQTRRWNPKTREYVFTTQNGISIIDLEKTYECLKTAEKFIEDLVASGKDILFVATKRQAQDLMREAAKTCNMPFAVNRWMGGCLTNFETVKGSLDKYRRYLRMASDGSLEKMHKKEAAVVRRQMARMDRSFEGLLNFNKLPGAIFAIDIQNEEIAIHEASRLNIPSIGLVDTNSDPSKVTYPIPGNDDAVKSIRLIISVIADAVQAGLARRREAEPVATQVRQDIVSNEQEPEVTISKDLLSENQLTEGEPAKKVAKKPAARKPRAKKAE